MIGKSAIKQILPLLTTTLNSFNIDIDQETTKILDLIPKYIQEKQQEYQALYPALQVNVMFTILDNDIYMVAVGLSSEDGKTILKPLSDPFNLSEMVKGIVITDAIKLIGENEELTILEAIELSRI